MRKKKKSGSENTTLNKVILATAIITLMIKVVELIQQILQLFD